MLPLFPGESSLDSFSARPSSSSGVISTRCQGDMAHLEEEEESSRKNTFGREKSRNMCGKRRYLANSFFFLLSVNKRGVVVVGSKGGEKEEGARRVSFRKRLHSTPGKKIWKTSFQSPAQFRSCTECFEVLQYCREFFLFGELPGKGGFWILHVHKGR